MTSGQWSISLDHVAGVTRQVEDQSVQLTTSAENLVAALASAHGGSPAVARALGELVERVTPALKAANGRVSDGIVGARLATQIYDDGLTRMVEDYDQSVFPTERFGPRNLR